MPAGRIPENLPLIAATVRMREPAEALASNRERDLQKDHIRHIHIHTIRTTSGVRFQLAMNRDRKLEAYATY